MSWLGRLFGSTQPAPLNSVVIADDLAASLAAAGDELSPAVDAALRAFLAAQARAVAGDGRGQVPFWLHRDAERPGDLEDELRDRVIHRRAAEDDRS